MNRITYKEYLKALEVVKIYHAYSRKILNDNIEYENKLLPVEITSIKLRDCKLSARTINSINAYNSDMFSNINLCNEKDELPLFTIGDLLQWSPKNLLRIRNIGIRSVNELLELLSRHSLTLNKQ